MDEFTQKRVHKLMKAGMDAVSAGNIKLARDKFRGAAEIDRAAEPLTYWGWMEHHLGNTDTAISLCEEAIVIDPDFGNPYNDIGSYLISKGDFGSAIPWLEKAKTAVRYEPRHFPYVNLARVYLAQNQPVKALEELRQAIPLVPHDAALRRMLRDLEESIH